MAPPAASREPMGSRNNKAQHGWRMPTLAVNSDGSITLDRRRITLPSVFLEEVVGAGANGIVVKGRHRVLSVPLAVKFWVSLRRRDRRDKMAQGLAEVKKMFATEHYHSVVRARDAGETQGIFYSVMDFFPGPTLEAWLNTNPSLGVRRSLARRLVDDVCAFSHRSIYHGDLHPRNILVSDAPELRLRSGEPRFGIIDFGTSLFSSRSSSRARHWRIFTQTLNELLKPFEIRSLENHPFPAAGSPQAIRSWYRNAIVAMRFSLIQLGADWLINPEEMHDSYKQEWPSRAAMLQELFPVPPRARQASRALVERGILILSAEYLGPANLWWDPDDQPTLIDEDEIGWTTSRTDMTWWSRANHLQKS
jgi:serine/threonine protein kinase